MLLHYNYYKFQTRIVVSLLAEKITSEVCPKHTEVMISVCPTKQPYSLNSLVSQTLIVLSKLPERIYYPWSSQQTSLTASLCP